MEKLTSQNGKIRIICDGYRYRKDADIAGGGSSFRCLRAACRGRMKIDVDDKVLSSTEHNHAPEPEIKKDRQITASESHAGKWMLVEPRKPLSKTDANLYREATPLNIAKASTKDAAVQTEPKDFSCNSPSVLNSAEVWKQLTSKDVPVRITNVKRRRLNKEYNWRRYLPFQRFLKFKRSEEH